MLEKCIFFFRFPLIFFNISPVEDSATIKTVFFNCTAVHPRDMKSLNSRPIARDPIDLEK